MGCCGGIATLIDARVSRVLASRVYGPNCSDLTEDAAELVDPATFDGLHLGELETSATRFFDSRRIHGRASDHVHAFVQQAPSIFGSKFSYSGVGAAVDGVTLHLAAHFFDETPSAEEAFILFEIVFDHFECALRVGARPFNRESARALIRVDCDGRVNELSKGAERLLRERPALKICEDRLRAGCGAQQCSLDHTLARVLRSGGVGLNPAAVQIEHEFGRPWILVVRPVTEYYGPFGVLRRNVDIEILDHLPMIGCLDFIQSLFDLTGRELQVLRLLAQGHSIDSLSATIDISRNTTRAHLRSIYSKTRTSSQLELMQLSGGLSNVAADDLQVSDLELVN